MPINDKQELIIHVPKEFSFQQNINYLSHAKNECMFNIHDYKICKAIPIANEISLVEISEAVNGNLVVHFLNSTKPISTKVSDGVTDYIRDWFDLDNDLKPFYEMANKDPLLHRAIKEFYGLRSIGIPDFFEAFCWGIIGQQINLTFAYTLKRRFVETFGSSVEWENEQYWIFPEPETIAALTVEDLTPLKMTTRKCEYLIGIAQLIASGELTKEFVMSADNFKDAEKMLTKIRGIGPWTANYVLMRCLRFPNAFPLADVGLQNAIKFLTGAKEKPTREEVLELSIPWKDWESYAIFYLWRFLY